MPNKRVMRPIKQAVKRRDIESNPAIVAQLEVEAEKDLPSQGFRRREVLAQRADTLAELAEGPADGPELVRADPKATQIENEIAGPIMRGVLDVSNKDTAYDYSWVNFASQHGYAVTFKQSLGWEVVNGPMLEAVERRDELGRRKIGDVILMRVKKDLHLAQQFSEQDRRRALRENVGVGLLELADKHRDKGVSARISTEALSSADMARVQKEESAKQMAGQQFDRMVRTGQVSGMQLPRG